MIDYMNIPIPETTVTQEQIDERNKETSKREVTEFTTNPPIKYFAYINEHTSEVTNWIGDKLGDVTFGPEFTSNMGDKRQSIIVHAINGKVYWGNYYKSAGDYCRITQFKHQH